MTICSATFGRQPMTLKNAQPNSHNALHPEAKLLFTIQWERLV